VRPVTGRRGGRGLRVAFPLRGKTFKGYGVEVVMEQIAKFNEVWQDDFFSDGEPDLIWKKTDGNGNQVARYKELAKGEMVRVSPGEYAWVPREGCTPGKYVMCRWVKRSDGKFRPVSIGGKLVRLCPEVAAEMGFRHLNRRVRYETIMRLWRADLIEMVKIAPQVYLLDIESWFRYLSECMENTEMWDKGSETRAEYRYKNGLS